MKLEHYRNNPEKNICQISIAFFFSHFIYSGTLAHGNMVSDDFALGINAALRARVLALEVYAGALAAALPVAVTFMSATGNWRTMVARQTLACGHIVHHFALCVLATRTWMAQLL